MSEFKRHKSVKAKKPNNIVITLKGFIKDLTKDIKTVDDHLDHENKRLAWYSTSLEDELANGAYSEAKHTTKCKAAAEKRIAKWESVRASLIVVRRGYEDDLRTLRDCYSKLDKFSYGLLAIGSFKDKIAYHKITGTMYKLHSKYKEYAV